MWTTFVRDPHPFARPAWLTPAWLALNHSTDHTSNHATFGLHANDSCDDASDNSSGWVASEDLTHHFPDYLGAWFLSQRLVDHLGYQSGQNRLGKLLGWGRTWRRHDQASGETWFDSWLFCVGCHCLLVCLACQHWVGSTPNT